MKKNGNLFKSVVALIISQVIVKLFGLLYKLYLANKTGFGDEGNAIYNSGYQIYALLLTISSIGVPNAVAKIVAENKNNEQKLAETLKGSFILFSIIGIVGSCFLAIFSGVISTKLINIPEAKQSLIALSPAIFNVCIISVLRGYFNGINKVEVTAKSQTIEQIFKTIITITLVEISYILTSSNTVIMAAFANFATTLATLACFIYLNKKNKLRSRGVSCNIRRIIKILYISVPISLSSILASLNRNIDSVTIVRYLKKFIGERRAKVEYGVLCGKIDVISAVPVSFIIAIATTIIPIVAEKNKCRDTQGLKNLVVKYIKYTILITLPCSICLAVFSKEVLLFLFGSDSGTMLLRISAIGIVFISMEQIINAVLQGIGKLYIPAIALTIGVFVKTIINIKLLNLSPYEFWFAGTVGCCIATLVCHVIAFFISFLVLIKKLKIKCKIFKFLLKPIIASCIMAVTLNYAFFILKGIINEKIAIIIAGLIATIIYIISIFGLKILKVGEIFGSNIQKVRK